jgi:hypothetical protein
VTKGSNPSPSPAQPVLEQLQGFDERELQDESQLLFQQIGAEERLVDLLDPAQLALLPRTEISAFFHKAHRLRWRWRACRGWPPCRA